MVSIYVYFKMYEIEIKAYSQFLRYYYRGGHHFMFGGDVSGGRVLGKYPDDFAESPTNPIALSRGRMIPTHVSALCA